MLKELKCYNFRCNKECDLYEKAICLYRMTKEQAELVKSIRNVQLCDKCGHELLVGKGKYSKNKLGICMNCKAMKKESV